MKHYIAIDLESWVYPDMPYYFKNLTCEEKKKLDNGWILDSTRCLLDLLSKYNTKLTFFILGQVYEWYPFLIEEISSEGHEIGYHTHEHRHIYNSKILEEEIMKSLNFLKKYNPKGFQAPEVILPRESYPILRKYGFEYSSSIYFSTNNIPLFQGIREIPISTFRFRGNGPKTLSFPRPLSLKMLLREIPFGSGYFIALLGLWGTTYFIRKYEKNGLSSVFFIHNWQIFPPEDATFPSKKYLLSHPHYLPYTRKIEHIFSSLLRNFKFDKLCNFPKKDNI